MVLTFGKPIIDYTPEVVPVSMLSERCKLGV
jgi:hypothetical protein